MSILPGAHDFTINGGEFSVHQNITSGPSGIGILLEASIPDAAVDAEARKYDPKCFPNTRDQYIHDIVNWAIASTDEMTMPIYWMRGPAGVGKSAIAQTCAEKVKEVGQLGAAFFFSVNGRSDPTHFFPTLAYQLSTIFSDYRQIVNDRVSNDPTLVHKRLSAQFMSLIVEPLQDLGKQGKGVGRRAIFIDGLDECQDNEAQCEIIELISASALDNETPFRWVFFSRPEPHIKAIFNSDSISPLCRCVLLPISRKADGEIERYLKGGFKNILRRRNLLSMSASWPTNVDIQKLVETAAGLFAYPAAVLRFIDSHASLDFQSTLKDVLKVIASPNDCPSLSISPFTELDRLYMLIMKRIPKNTLSSVRLFLALQLQAVQYTDKIALISNMLGFSEAEMKGVCHQLHAVLEVQDNPELTRPVFNVHLIGSSLLTSAAIRSINHALTTISLFRDYGVVHFHHKSFQDFLVDPKRSSNFCVTTPAMRTELFNHLIDRHHHLCQRTVVCQSGLDFSLDMQNSAENLSWLPVRDASINTSLQLRVAHAVTFHFSHDNETLKSFLEDVPSYCLQKLALLDYRKDFIADSLIMGYGVYGGSLVAGRPGSDRVLPGVIFSRVHDLAHTEAFDSKAFFGLVKKLESLGVIKRYHPNLPSNIASIYYAFPRNKSSGTNRGQYVLGHGDKSVIWFWEFDTELEYFHEFRTLDFCFTKAIKIYEAAKFTMWDMEWVPPPLDEC